MTIPDFDKQLVKQFRDELDRIAAIRKSLREPHPGGGCACRDGHCCSHHAHLEGLILEIEDNLARCIGWSEHED